MGKWNNMMIRPNTCIAVSYTHLDVYKRQGEGAEKFAHKEGFERKNMLTSRAKIHYKNRLKEVQQQDIKPYSGHDTVGMVCLDTKGKMTSATSTSGLFMKKKGRVGDSPI